LWRRRWEILYPIFFFFSSLMKMMGFTASQ